MTTRREMNDLAKRWVEALRSGKYEQGVGCLRSADNRFCCLGVLCDVADPGRWSSLSGGGYHYYTSVHLPPVRLLHEAGFSRMQTGYFGTADVFMPDGTSLVEMNDDGESFATIADAIEAVLTREVSS